VPDQTQHLAEARHGQETAVLRVGNLPYLAQDGWGKLGALEELDGNFACDDAQLLCVGLVEEILEDALFLGREVEDGLVCAWLAWAPRPTPVSRSRDILNSAFCAWERSAMAVCGQATVWGGKEAEACGDEAEAPGAVV
jgi:hypothetical protein